MKRPRGGDNTVIVPDIGTHEVYAGDDWSLTFRLNIDNDGTLTPEDLTGWAGWRSTWRPRPGSIFFIDLDVEVNLPNEIVLRATGPTTTAMLPKSSGVFDVQAIRDGITRTFLRGSTTHVSDVTL